TTARSRKSHASTETRFTSWRDCWRPQILTARREIVPRPRPEMRTESGNRIRNPQPRNPAKDESKRRMYDRPPIKRGGLPPAGPGQKKAIPSKKAACSPEQAVRPPTVGGLTARGAARPAASPRFLPHLRVVVQRDWIADLFCVFSWISGRFSK